MRKRSAFIFLAVLPIVAASATKQYQITIDNPMHVAREAAPVVIKLTEIDPGFEVLKSLVLDGATEIPSQIDDVNCDGIFDEVAFVIDIPASGERTLQLCLSDEGSNSEFDDGRFYTDIIQYAAGINGGSLGGGAFKGWDGEKITNIDSVENRSVSFISSGPVRIIAEVKMDNCNYQGSRINITNRYTLYAAHRDLQMDVEFDLPLSDQMFATGAQRLIGYDSHSWSDHTGLTASWGCSNPGGESGNLEKDTVGIAVYMPRQYIYGEAATPDGYIYKVKAPGNRTLRYHSMLASSKKSLGPGSKDSWLSFLSAWKEDIKNPIRVVIKEKEKE